MTERIVNANFYVIRWFTITLRLCLNSSDADITYIPKTKLINNYWKYIVTFYHSVSCRIHFCVLSIFSIIYAVNNSKCLLQVNQSHQGRYTCTPYNAQGTQGSSGQMEVLVRKPPVFTLEPEPMYQRKVGETVEMHCDAQEAEGTQKPNIQWQRVSVVS